MTETEPTKDIKGVLDSLENKLVIINKNLNKQNSFPRSFLLSVVQGVGTAIGATIVAGILIAIFYKVIILTHIVPFINKIVPQEAVQQILDYSKKK
jgi:hypothetical protein